MGIINHDEAFSLEMIVRGVYKCDRYGVMGVANADHLELSPMDAVLVVFAPLYKNEKEIIEIDDFVDRYNCIFNFPDDYEYNKETVADFIKEFRSLVEKYIK